MPLARWPTSASKGRNVLHRQSQTFGEGCLRGNLRGALSMSTKLVLLIATTLFSWICAGCTVHCFWQFFRNPTSFSSGPFERRTFSYTYVFLVWVGLGYCIFRGVEATVQWMPRTWVIYFEDGELMWSGANLAFIVAFFGSQVFYYEMLKLAQRLQDCELYRSQQGA